MSLEDVERIKTDMMKGKDKGGTKNNPLAVDLTKDNNYENTVATAYSESDSDSGWDPASVTSNDLDEMSEDKEFMGSKDIVLSVEGKEIDELLDEAIQQVEGALCTNFSDEDIAQLKDDIEEIVQEAVHKYKGG